MPTIALIGDSQSQALWPRVTKALSAQGYTVVLSEANPSWSENTYRTKMPSLPAALASAKPEVVVIELGGNARPSKGEAAYREDVAWLVDAARASGAKRIIWFGPATSIASINADAADRHEKIANMQAYMLPAMGVEWYDSRPITMTDQKQKDGVHFERPGYDRWAAWIVERILAPAPKMEVSLQGAGAAGTGSIPKAAVIAGTVAVSALLIVLTLRLRGRL
jgi:lysophospholipase L1-like esterase